MTTLYPNRKASSPLENQIRTEFLTESAIALEVFNANVKIIPDIEIDPVTKEVIATPIDDFLNKKYTRFTHQAKENLLAASFYDHLGNPWQLKLFGKPTQNGKTGQYLAPWRIGDIPYLPAVPESISKILGIDPAGNFWEEFKLNKNLPLLITEGGKKALSAISAGLPTISLFGCNCGINRDGTLKGILPELVEGRPVIIALDRDVKPKAIKQVNRAIGRLSRAIQKLGGTAKVALWDKSLGKGLDDFIKNVGKETALQILINKSLSYKSWKSKKNSYIISDLPQNLRYLDPVETPETANCIVFKSIQGTGKTTLMESLVRKYLEEGRRILIFTHRIYLAKFLADKFGVDHVSEIEEGETKGALGISLCIDSAHKDSLAKFSPDDWKGAVIILDELDQFLWHTLEAATAVKKKRAEILNNFVKTLNAAVEGGGKIITASADITQKEIDLLKNLIPSLNPFVIENEFRFTVNQTAYFFSNPQELYKKLEQDLERGKKVLILTDTQKSKSQTGAVNLEKRFKNIFPSLKGIRLDSQTTHDPEHECQKILNNWNLLKNYDYAIASPVLETGVSLDLTGHFDAVYQFSVGVLTVNSLFQQNCRLREFVPRYIYCPKSSRKNIIGNGSEYWEELSNNELTKAKVLSNELLPLLAEDFKSKITLGNSTYKSFLDYWARIGAIRNWENRNYLGCVKAKFIDFGYTVKDWENVLNDSELKEVKMHMKQTKEDSITKEMNQILECDKELESKENLEIDKEIKILESRPKKTSQEQLKEKTLKLKKKWNVKLFYELLLADIKGFYPKIKLLYWLTIGRSKLEEKEVKNLETLSDNGNVDLFVLDVNKNSHYLKVKFLEYLGIPDLIKNLGEFSHDSPQIQAFFEICQKSKKLLKDIFGINIGDATPIHCLRLILDKIGYKPKYLQRKREENVVKRLYTIIPVYDWYEMVLSAF